MDEFENTLATMLSRRLPGFEELLSASRLTGGASQQTWRLVARQNGAERKLCLRRNTGAVSAGSIAPATEAGLIRAAAVAGVPEPEVFHILEPGDDLGEGFLMEWLEGDALGGRITHSSRFAGVRPGLARQCGEILARLHDIDVEATGMAAQLTAATPEELVHATWQQYRELGTPQPMLDYSARWLLDHLPPVASPRLVHGDFRNGNLMVSPESGVVGVLDWELAGIGDPIRDLGWVCTNSWRFGRADLPVGGFGTIDDLLAGYRSVSGVEIERDHLQFWIVFGSFWWSVCCLLMANSYRTGENPSVERPAIGRRASEGQADCVALVIPGAVDLPIPVGADCDELPRQGELLSSVRDFLAREIAPDVGGASSYLSRVAANSLAIVEREQRLGPAYSAAEDARLSKLVSGANRAERRWQLVELLRGSLALDTPGLAEHLRNSVMGQLAIDQPGYAVTPNASATALWERWLETQTAIPGAREQGYQVWHFCDNEADANECLELVLAGRKRATASARWSIELAGESLPSAGDLSIVTDWSGQARCLLRTTSVDEVPYDEVTAEFAAEEGEGDGTLEWWRRAHSEFYSRELSHWGRTPTDNMPILCERFEVLFTT